MRLTEEQRKAVMCDRDEHRPCRTCKWRYARHHRRPGSLGCMHSKECNYAHDGWEPVDNYDMKHGE